MRAGASVLGIVAVAALAGQGCGVSSPGQRVKASTSRPHAGSAGAGRTRAAVEKKTLAAVGLDGSALDRRANPCVDFYQFACGSWVEKTTIPSDQARWLRSFSEIRKRNESELRQILEGAAAEAPAKPTSPVQQIGAFYRACMDQAAIDKLGAQPIAAQLKAIRRLRRRSQLQPLIEALHQERIWAFFSLEASQDFKDATLMIAQLDQAGLGLPDRDYYLRSDKKSERLRTEYRAHLRRMLALVGYAKRDLTAAAANVMRIETGLARVSKSQVERRDPQGMYNRVDREGLVKMLPALDWPRYFSALGRGEVSQISVTAPAFFAGVEQLLRREGLGTLRDYLVWRVVEANAMALAGPFEREAFSFARVLTGQKVQRERWKRCVEATDEALPELLAQPYVARRFSAASKSAVRQMVGAISAAFRARLKEIVWMDGATRARAEAKLSKMSYLIGYPDRWKDYPFPIGPSYASNRLAARAHQLRRELAKIGKPVDPREWEMSPPTVNAYYHPLKNHMVFPAGILQPPFFDVGAALAVNLGAMGMVVAHELTHGFDDQGAQFDEGGNLKNWWSPKVAALFQAKTGCIERQYAAFAPLPGLKLNGKLTLGENIADAGGVKLAYRAFKALRSGAKTKVVADGFSEEQQFFLSVGQLWCAKQREELVRLRAATDPHSPPRFRVNGTLANLSEFATAFSCESGTPMNPKERCEVW